MIPAALIFVNSDLNDLIRELLLTQLFISKGSDGYSDGYPANNYAVMSGAQFDGYYAANPNYVNKIHGSGTRVLVIRDILRDKTIVDGTKNYPLADIFLFIKSGLAYVEKNNFGPPRLALSIYDMTIYDFLRYNKKIT